MTSRTIRLATTAVLLLLLMCVLRPTPALAAVVDDQDGMGLQSAGISASSYVAGSPSWTISTTSVTLKDYSNSAIVYVRGYDDDYWWYKPKAVTSNSSVVSVAGAYRSGDDYYFRLTKKGVGNAVVTISDGDDEGQSRSIDVSCVPNDFSLTSNGFAFSKATASYSTYYVSPTNNRNNVQDAIVTGAISSRPKVASVRVLGSGRGAWVQITPKKAGKATITVFDQYGRSQAVAVTVAKNYFKANLKARTSGSVYCRSKVAYVYSVPKAKVKLTVGGRTYSKRTNGYGTVKIKLKSEPPLNSKFTVRASANRAKATYKGKVASNVYAYVGTLTSCKYYADVHASNVRKGDVIILKVGSETYKHKVPFSADSYTTTFWTRYTQRSYWHYQVIVKNKNGKKLYKGIRNVRWR